MKDSIVLLYASQYAIPDEHTGVIKEGITANYYFVNKFKVTNNANGSVGSRPAKGGIPIDCFQKIVKAPAIYEAEFDMTTGSDGKTCLVIQDLDYVSDVALQPIVPVDASKKI